jgi:NAD(P)-dependent dehydrogenase (short-subunit alcohol dehydrogenase family)
MQDDAKIFIHGIHKYTRFNEVCPEMENSMKRWGDPREVAPIAASIASEDFAFADGKTIVIDGGTVMP